MSITMYYPQQQSSWSSRDCVICCSKAIGFNFGVLTCAPCKAFFRRNARRREIVEAPCQHRYFDLYGLNHADEHNVDNYYLHIRRCPPCRLRRCFDMGMKEELVRTEEENNRHKQLVEMNRRKREFLKHKKQEKSVSVIQCIVKNNNLLSESDWCHLSNVVSAYETHCLKTYLQQRPTMTMNEIITNQYQTISMKHYVSLPMSLTMSLSSFLQSLPAFHSLSHTNRTYLSTNNLRSLLFPNMFELNQLCFSEPWQVSLERATWELICGPPLYEQFARIMKLAEKSVITDPIITRLWMVVLFFSSSLFCLFDRNASVKYPKKKTCIVEIQDVYVGLLWKYLLHRYGSGGAVQIYSNLIHIYLNMQRVGFEIGVQVRTRKELLVTYETLNNILTLNSNDR